MQVDVYNLDHPHFCTASILLKQNSTHHDFYSSSVLDFRVGIVHNEIGTRLCEALELSQATTVKHHFDYI